VQDKGHTTTSIKEFLSAILSATYEKSGSANSAAREFTGGEETGNLFTNEFKSS